MEQPPIRQEPTSTPPQVSIAATPPTKFRHPSQRRLIVFLTSCLLILGTLLAGLLLYRYFTAAQPVRVAPKKLYPGRITIVSDVWPGYIGFYVAQKKGYFTDAGLKVDPKIYDSITQGDEEYLAGTAQGKLNINLELVQESLKGFEEQAVLMLDTSNGADGIIALPSITDFSQLKGKKVAYEFGTVEEFFLRYALERYKLSLDDITGVDLGPEEAAQALADKKVDVAVTYEPYLSSVAAKTKYNELFSTATEPNLIADILTFNKQFIDRYPDSIEAILRAYFKGLDYAKQYPQESYQILAQALTTPVSDIASQLKGIKIQSLQDNRAAFTVGPGLQSLYGNLRSIKQFETSQSSVMKRDLDSDMLVNSTFIKKIAQ